MMEQHSDEIDLLELFNNMLKSIYYFFNRWYKTLTIVIVVGFILGLIVYFKEIKTYQNTMIGYSPSINPVLVVNIINSLEQVNKSDKKGIQKILKLPEFETSNIITFHADTIETLKNHITTIKVKLIYKDSIDVSKFAGKLIDYINENPYIKKQLIIQKNKLNASIAQTEIEISKLDSLQKALLKNASKKPGLKPGSFMISNDQITNFYHNDILKLSSNKQSYIANLQHLTGFEPINQFEPAKIKEQSLIKTVLIFSSIAFGLAFFILLILEIRKKAIRLINKE